MNDTRPSLMTSKEHAQSNLHNERDCNLNFRNIDNSFVFTPQTTDSFDNVEVLIGFYNSFGGILYGRQRIELLQ